MEDYRYYVIVMLLSAIAMNTSKDNIGKVLFGICGILYLGAYILSILVS